MPDETGSDEGSRRFAPTHAPMWITVLAIVIATGFASALVYVLVNETSGPGEVVRSFYEAVEDGDCDDAVDSTTGIDEASLCAATDGLGGTLPDDPKVVSITLSGDGERSASVQIEEAPGTPPVTWNLALDGSEWKITGCPNDGLLANAC